MNSAAHDQVSAATERLRLAMISPEPAALATLFADELSYGHSDGKIDTKASITASLLDGSSDFTTVDLSEQTVAVVGDVALVRHRLVADTNDSGKPGHVKLKILLVWQQRAGDWVLLARQAVRIAA
ncbi:nuclear transport factor 2 family protein [soil metagenome]